MSLKSSQTKRERARKAATLGLRNGELGRHPPTFPRLQSGVLPAAGLLCPVPSTSTCFLASTANGIDLRCPFGHREWVLRVSVPSSVIRPRAAEGLAFDPVMLPLFGLAEIRAAIPKHFWVRDPWRSMSYAVRDVVVLLGLAAAAVYINSWIVWSLYWVAQGAMFWALFVLGHDCFNSAALGMGVSETTQSLTVWLGICFILPFLFLTTDGNNFLQI
ncbi:hypothetical protein ZIOFF_005123 [Zingiber officinale]|uniref:Fatty acid desaturase N-terminal domain-containing protein n=1 Tax=Zingiber officinale TaxID=94328 RepID=A0A8J5HLZ7_ZINOF|nr:hypothetical protein ZIOFF_005123 [Zingiber officinale]